MNPDPDAAPGHSSRLCVGDGRFTGCSYPPLGLAEIENKTRRPTIRWFAFDGHRAIHLIGGAGGPPPERPMAAHFCLSMPVFDETLKYLAERGVRYVSLAGEPYRYSLRGDGVRQT